MRNTPAYEFWEARLGTWASSQEGHVAIRSVDAHMTSSALAKTRIEQIMRGKRQYLACILASERPCSVVTFQA